MSGRIYDISPLISEQTAVFPGDQPYRRTVSREVSQGDSYGLSRIETTLHLGAHTDAPNHYPPGGVGIDQRELSRYFGPCEIVTARAREGRRIRPRDLFPFEPKTARVLIKTLSFPDPNCWNSDFHALSEELVEWLASRRVQLIGIDTPSIDPADDTFLESHRSMARHDLGILEGVVLNQVPDGLYTLMATPLRLANADASPVRAFLLDQDLPLGQEIAWEEVR